MVSHCCFVQIIIDLLRRDFNGNHHGTNALEKVMSSEDGIRSVIMEKIMNLKYYEKTNGQGLFIVF